jgi:hypothetical protein
LIFERSVSDGVFSGFDVKRLTLNFLPFKYAFLQQTYKSKEKGYPGGGMAQV